MTAPFTVLGHEMHISSTIGVSLFPKDGADPETLLKHADTALYRAKDRGRNRYQFFDARMNAHAQERLLLENGLRRAIERGEFVLHYQPQIDLQTDAVTGVEALIRWHPEQRMVLPGEFIPIAEETGLITEIGEWVLRTACRQGKEWEAAGLLPVRMAVNVSIRQLRRREFPGAGSGYPARDRVGAATPRARDHRIEPDGRPRADHQDIARVARHGYSARDG